MRADQAGAAVACFAPYLLGASFVALSPYPLPLTTLRMAAEWLFLTVEGVTPMPLAMSANDQSSA